MKTFKNNNQDSNNVNQQAQSQPRTGTGPGSPEQWWAGLSAAQRGLAQQVALMMAEVSESKRVEIRREREAIRARFVYILQQPEPGCLSAIVLPETSRAFSN